MDHSRYAKQRGGWTRRRCRATNIKIVRVTAGLTLAAVAAECAMSVGRLSAIERDLCTTVTSDDITLIETAINTLSTRQPLTGALALLKGGDA